MKKNNFSAIFGYILMIAIAFGCAPKKPKEGINTSSELKQLFADYAFHKLNGDV